MRYRNDLTVSNGFKCSNGESNGSGVRDPLRITSPQSQNVSRESSEYNLPPSKDRKSSPPWLPKSDGTQWQSVTARVFTKRGPIVVRKSMVTARPCT
jgi:hypothetical protein